MAAPELSMQLTMDCKNVSLVVCTIQAGAGKQAQELANL